MAIPVKFKYGKREDYQRVLDAGKVDKDTLYFIEDTGEILHGSRNLARGNHYEGIRAEGEVNDIDVITRVITDNGYLIVKDDIFVIKTPIADDKMSYTSYVYDGVYWCAMDGNYNAENVFFDEDLTFTKEVGYVTLENGSATIESKGKNVKQVLEMLFNKEEEPNVTLPKAEITVPAFGEYEVGTTIIEPEFNVAFNGGNYEFGPNPTGVSAVTYTVTCNGKTQNAAEGKFDSIQVTDTTNIAAEVVVDYSTGDIPLTNLGNNVNDENIAIAAGQCSDVSDVLAGYRKMFWGASNTAELNSTNIRALAHSSKPVDGTLDLVEANDNTVCVIVAIPVEANKKISEVLMPSSMNANVTAIFEKQADTVLVEGAEGYAGVAYNVWMYQPPKLSANSTFEITIADI